MTQWQMCMQNGKAELKIAVCMKYVPADLTDSVDKQSGGIFRTAENSTINQTDKLALEAALRLKHRYGGSVSVYTMGPAFSENLLKEACAFGADQTFLITDRLLAGADSYVTALVLSTALGARYDLILCGERTVDGETGQVPGEISARLNASFTTGVTEIVEISQNSILCCCLTDTAQRTVSLPLPAVLGISTGISKSLPGIAPSLQGLRRARECSPVRLDAQALGLSSEELGITGSPTAVVKVFSADWSRDCRMAKDLRQGVELSLEVMPHE